jgi:hypothetical protein
MTSRGTEEKARLFCRVGEIWMLNANRLALGTLQRFAKPDHIYSKGQRDESQYVRWLKRKTKKGRHGFSPCGT